MKKALVVGGNSGIGLSIVLKLLDKGVEHIHIVDKKIINEDVIPSEHRDIFEKNTTQYQLDLNTEDYSIFDEIDDIDTLIITAGFGRLALFQDLTECEIKNLIKCNELSAIQIIKKYYDKLMSDKDFNCAVMVSIAGHLVSPYFSVYGAAKAGIAMFVENINAELGAQGYSNRVLDCSPGSIKGTSFNGGKNDCDATKELAQQIIDNMLNKNTLFIPQYEQVYKDVLDRYHNDPQEYGIHSYNYKKESGRISDKPQVTIGYLSGTFDLFHIGHLNLLKRAKSMCDYLIVGVHNSGAWKGKETFIPFEERKEIVGACKYVDMVIPSFAEDCDAWPQYHYHKLFVGSDYKGSERFMRYEEYFKDKDAEIVYLPYTQSTSSTQIRKTIVSKTQDLK